MASYLPEADGYLPYWLLFIAFVSLFNTIQSFLTTSMTAQVYALAPSATNASTATKDKSSPRAEDIQVTPLQSRLFGTWTFVAKLVRLYAAYNIHDPALYQLAVLTYVVAFLHFSSEWLVFGTAKWGRGLAGPILVSVTSLMWMGTQYQFYIK
ncbi:uncharacterized protein KY384_003319 [Bacidia gigantensis]|uniref:uncharacterized protein n=1 Tax=Bacidia gigantensis TaxID=2732470 RepID=UPI001D0397A7|nr:uncharacterized protein KY384_003319 [Bacidia gigantensis]KAG8531687.1 hypothetical protein KY384_003319 [Bacidia gigantensis]